ncbi:MAG: TetR/AcrR family transcriptional regulator [Flavobacteriales bacterium]|nr:TetR/AcrR family transcriptional regulator [Flavobacteriales bacterium]MCX7649760.1 TetR/AcrR family transcriptional regulator [Flavobacteriales bacterium]MDW8431206.1 TetR/AcrR family transcriptional regulator [Flavobacteriales bacterium]
MTAEEILHVATQQFLRHGLRNVSMDDLARICGISKKTIYKFFEDKESLIRRALEEFLHHQRLISDLSAQQAQNAIEAHCRMVRQLSLQMQEFTTHVTYELRKYYPALWELIENFHKTYVTGFIRENLKRGIREGLYEKDVDTEMTPSFYVALIRGVLMFDTDLMKNYSFPKVYQYLILYHLMAITTPAGKEEIKRQFSELNL